MRKTLLLVFIHGFKGGDDTFGTFPEHLRALISHAFPKVEVMAIAYPRFETRGELKDCVARFREWLENKVIDIEVANSTPSPTIDPSVHTILIGHSMGGLVAAETFLLLASEQPIPAASSNQNPAAPNFPSNTTLHSATSTSHPTPSTDDHTSMSQNTFMFPHVQGILAFDTPFLGLAPGMVAHSLEGGHKMASSAYGAFSEISSAFGWGAGAESSVPSPPGSKQIRALPAPSSSTADAAATPKWQSWGKYAMFAGAAGAVAAGGAAALYSQREKISAGWGWAIGHLAFVGTLGKPEELRKRVGKLEEECEERGVGSANFFTNLGKGASDGYGVTSEVLGRERTFCNLPTAVTEGKKSDGKGMQWRKAINEKAKDETVAHMSMFFPRDNPGFYTLGEGAKEVVTSWIDDGWYQSSEAKRDGKGSGMTLGEIGDEDVRSKEREKSVEADWEGLDGTNDIDDDVKMTDEVLDTAENKENMEGSVIVDKASKGEIPLPQSQEL